MNLPKPFRKAQTDVKFLNQSGSREIKGVLVQKFDSLLSEYEENYEILNQKHFVVNIPKLQFN